MAITRTPPLGLSRDQLAEFLPNHEAIKAFENLFGIVESIAPDVVAQVLLAAGNAQSTAIQALTALPQAVQDAAIACATSEARATQALQAVEALRTAVEMAALAPPRVPAKRTRFGQFYDTTSQIAALPNVAYPITYNTTDLSYGVRLRSPSTSEIEVDTEGVYNFQFSVQLDKTSGGAANFWIWPRLNGVDVPNSASQIQIQGNNHEIFSAANFMFDLKARDYLQFMWSVSDVSVQLQYFAAAGVVPAIPSIIVTVSNNIRTYQ